MKLVLMPSAENRLLTVLKLNLLNCLVCASLGMACRVLMVGTAVPRQEPGLAPNWGMCFASCTKHGCGVITSCPLPWRTLCA